MCQSSGGQSTDAKRDCDEPTGYIGRCLVFYAQYHSHPVNIAIHVVFVPVLVFSALVLFAYLPSLRLFKEGTAPDGIPFWLTRSLELSVGSLLLVLYTWLYSSWDPVAGLSWTAIIGLPLVVSANYFRSEVDTAWAWALGLQVLALYMQVHPGHLIFEKRKPAVLDGVVEALVTAPLFVWLDVLFLFGYRSQLKATVEAQAMEARQKAMAAETAARSKAA